MFFEKYFERWKLMLGFTTGICGVIFFILFRPLSTNVDEVFKNLNTEKKKILLNSRYGFTPTEIRKSFFSAREENLELEKSLDSFSSLFEFPEPIVQLTQNEFQNTEYELERFNLISQIQQDALKKNVKLSINPDSSLPTFSSEAENPQLLWAHLETFRFIFDIILELGEIEVISMESIPSESGIIQNKSYSWSSLPAKLSLSGNGEKILSFLKFVPLTDSHLNSKYNVSFPGKPALTIKMVKILRTGKDPNQILMDCEIRGYVKLDNEEKETTP